MPSLITDMHLRLSEEEMNTLREMSALQAAPVTAVVRAMLRHFILEWRAGRDVSIDLGAVVWKHEQGHD